MDTQFRNERISEKDIAIIGMAGRFPGASNIEEFWQNIRNGIESITFFTDEELSNAGIEKEMLRDGNYVKAAPMIEDIEYFDAPFFGYSPREAEIMDPQQRILLELAWQSLENAGYVPEEFDGLIGVYASVAWNTYLLSNLCSNRELFKPDTAFNVFTSNDKDFMPTRISYKLNLKGPSMVIQTSCSSSLVAVHMAVLSLLNYECDMALAAGTTVKVPHISGYYYQEGGLASPDGRCRTFDADAKGTVFGSGAGVVVLKRAVEALKDGDNIYAVIKGSAINNDGSLKVSYTAPSVEGQSEVIAAAQAMAGINPETLRYIEAHGTGTGIGDPIEITALGKVFGESTDKKGFCAIGSVKSNVGHLDAASGIAGLIKTVMALKNAVIPPSPNFQRPNDRIDFVNSPFYVKNTSVHWNIDDFPRRAGVSSFGVGGTNAHLILEEAPPVRKEEDSKEWKLMVLSAKTQSALKAMVENLAGYLKENPGICLADAAYTLQIGREAFEHRYAFMCRNIDEAIDILENYSGTETKWEQDMSSTFAELGTKWTSGEEVNWKGLYWGENRHRIPLPAYPFEKQRYWIDPAAGESEYLKTDKPIKLHPRPKLQNSYVEPSSNLERLISDIWAKTFGFEKIGIYDSFFELGGDSLIAVQMVNSAKRILKRDIEAASLYRAINIKTLAELLEKNESQAVSELETEFDEQKERISRRKQLQRKLRSNKK